ncbi:MAG: hypothetical protein KJO15_01310, partial [Alphaproteobacteria bacterium]|nr:hypothetical protein [Alphaproteobacteria bacterium]
HGRSGDSDKRDHSDRRLRKRKHCSLHPFDKMRRFGLLDAIGVNSSGATSAKPTLPMAQP